MKLCCIIPVHNEASAIGSLTQYLNKNNYPALVIDDGSTDGSGEIAMLEKARLIKHKERKGKGFSLREGFEDCLKRDYEGVVTLDGDGQHSVDDLENFVREAKKHPQSVIVGNRMDNTQYMPRIRIWTNQFMSFLISKACGQKIPDSQCGYRYIGREVLESIELASNGFEIESEILMKASKKGYKIYSIPVRTIYAGEESKIHPVRDTWRFVTYFVKELFSK